MHREIISNCNGELWVTGRKVVDLDGIDLQKNIKLFKIESIIEAITVKAG